MGSIPSIRISITSVRIDRYRSTHLEPSTLEVKTGESGVQGHPWLHRELEAVLYETFLKIKICNLTVLFLYLIRIIGYLYVNK